MPSNTSNDISQQVQSILDSTRVYLTDHLLPFWIERSPDAECGGFLTYFDKHGERTGETEKTFLMQIRMLFTMASAHRGGYGDGRCGELAEMGARFIRDHYWDSKHGGWCWIADRKGQVTCHDKIGYGQCFGMYAFSEYFLATGDEMGKVVALDTYDAICQNMIDTRHGGFWEIMKRDWQPAPGGAFGGDRKSLDVHMHMMEALTSLCEMTGEATHRRRLIEVIELICGRMLDRETGLGLIQFAGDFKPLAAILFEVEWGRDAAPAEGARPMDHTSPGHNVEFVWLLLHAADVLGHPREQYMDIARANFDHCLEYGIDHEMGGVYAETPMAGQTDLYEKQFWQQAEVLVGLLDAYQLFGDEKYWHAFVKLHTYVFEKFVVMEAGGEWYERLNRAGEPIDDALGHAWKISYHTVRSMIQVIERLETLASSNIE